MARLTSQSAFLEQLHCVSLGLRLFAGDRSERPVWVDLTRSPAGIRTTGIGRKRAAQRGRADPVLDEMAKLRVGDRRFAFFGADFVDDLQHALAIGAELHAEFGHDAAVIDHEVA